MLMDCVIQCLMDNYATCSVCLLVGWTDGRTDRRTDGWMDGCCVNKGGRGCRGGRSASPAMQTKYQQHLGKTRSYVVWLLGLLVAGLVGLFVGLAALLPSWYSVGGCMDGRVDGWMDGWMDGCSVSTPCEPSIDRVTRFGFCIRWLLGFLVAWCVGWFVGLAALVLGWLVGWLALH